MRNIGFGCLLICSRSVDNTTSSASSRLTSAVLEADVVKTTTLAPIALASLTAKCTQAADTYDPYHGIARLTKLFQAFLAAFAFPARIYYAANCGKSPILNFVT